MAVLDVKGICKTFDKNTVVLRGIDFSLEKGESVAIIGSSGSGKTTLLRCLNFLTTPDEGKILVNGETLFDADDPATQKESEIRRKRLHFGLVFQNFNLFPQYTALQNVMLASELLAKEQPDYHARKKELHEEIRQNAEKLLTQLSGQYNRLRQAAITREITEISSGAKAQKQAIKKKQNAEVSVL